MHSINYVGVFIFLKNVLLYIISINILIKPLMLKKLSVMVQYSPIFLNHKNNSQKLKIFIFNQLLYQNNNS